MIWEAGKEEANDEEAGANLKCSPRAAWLKLLIKKQRTSPARGH